MTTYDNQPKGPRPAAGRYFGFDHLTFWVGNAKQAASYYVTRCTDWDYLGIWWVETHFTTIVGFTPVGYKGLETGHRDVVSHAVRQNNTVFVFQSPLNTGNALYSDYAQYVIYSTTGERTKCSLLMI